MIKLNFMCIGTQKSGTTTLDAYLRQHPNIGMPATQKELHFFDNETIDWQFPDYDSYHKHFNVTKEHRILGEITPIYLYWDNALLRIAKYNPKIKLIVLLRNPIERSYSHWNMEVTRGNEHRDFFSALLNEELVKSQHRVFSYTSRSLYAKQIKNLWSIFPRNQTLIIKVEDFFSNINENLKKIYEFLNVKNIQPSNILHLHKASYFNKLNAHELFYLKNALKEDILELQELLQWNCSDWLNYE